MRVYGPRSLAPHTDSPHSTQNQRRTCPVPSGLLFAIHTLQRVGWKFAAPLSKEVLCQRAHFVSSSCTFGVPQSETALFESGVVSFATPLSRSLCESGAVNSDLKADRILLNERRQLRQLPSILYQGVGFTHARFTQRRNTARETNQWFSAERYADLTAAKQSNCPTIRTSLKAAG